MNRNDELKVKYSALHIILFKKYPLLYKHYGKTAPMCTLPHRHCLYVSPCNSHENLMTYATLI